uniref:Divinyl ether synthase CYP74 n=1 Tax=Allium sativum TaxID=4682 RepID=CP74_ALLSA|nr:unspecific 9/13 divinyl ether synthase [Allium sativum]
MSTSNGSTENIQKPLRKIPDITGTPILTAIKDRLDFFYNQGQYEYFQSRVKKNNSTILRMNMIPGPFASNPKIVALCDAASFPTLFDPSKVSKVNSLTGNYMPALSFTGGYRVCAYLDPSEPTHTKIKQVFFNAQAAKKDTFIPTFVSTFNSMFDKMDAEVESKKKAEFTKFNEAAVFEFVGLALVGPKPAREVFDSAKKSVFFQFHPFITAGLPALVEELAFHMFPFPSFVAKSSYKILYEYFSTGGSWILDNAEEIGLSREEAIHHLIFTWAINAYLGIRTCLMRLFKWIVASGPDLQEKLAREVRSVVRSEEGKITFAGIEKMELVKSVAYESFRFDPPVQVQYGTAKSDLIIESHDGKYQVKKGEMLCGFQPMATRDPKVFDRADEFVPDRFMGDGKKLVKHVLWANGYGTDAPKADDKICAGKDLGVLVGRLLIAVMFLRYDKIGGVVGKTMEEVDVIVNELTKVAV